MQRYAIIDGINVINVIDYDEQPINPPPGFESHIIAVQSDTAGPGWTYIDGQLISPVVPQPTPEELLARCKQTAMSMLSLTDWTQAVDCPLMNKTAFRDYRTAVRALAINPVVNPTFPELPTEQW